MTYVGSTPRSSGDIRMVSCSTLSNAFLKSANGMVFGVLHNSF